MWNPGRNSLTHSRGFVFLSIRFLHAFAIFSSHHHQPTDATKSPATDQSQWTEFVCSRDDNYLTDEEERRVVTLEFNMQSIDSLDRQNAVLAIHRKTRQTIIDHLNRRTTPATTESTALSTTNDETTSPLFASTASTVTTPLRRKTTMKMTSTHVPVFIPISIVVTLSVDISHLYDRKRRRKRTEEVIIYTTEDLCFVQSETFIQNDILRISIFIRRKAEDVSNSRHSLYEIVNTPEFKEVFQKEFYAPIVKIYQGIPDTTKSNSTNGMFSNCILLWLSFLLHISNLLSETNIVR